MGDIKGLLPAIGSRVKLATDSNRWWDVRCGDERFAILTRQAAFQPDGVLRCTILDAVELVRGPCNLIGQGWDLHMTDEACAALLYELQVGAKVNAWNAGDRTFDLDTWLKKQDPDVAGHLGVEISHRNRVKYWGEIRSEGVYA